MDSESLLTFAKREDEDGNVVLPLDKVLKRLKNLCGGEWYVDDLGEEYEDQEGIRYTIGDHPGPHCEQTIAHIYTANVNEYCAEMMFLANNYMPEILQLINTQKIEIAELKLKLLKAGIE